MTAVLTEEHVRRINPSRRTMVSCICIERDTLHLWKIDHSSVPHGIIQLLQSVTENLYQELFPDSSYGTKELRRRNGPLWPNWPSRPYRELH